MDKGKLIRSLKNVAYTCANINASACATYQPQLFIGGTLVESHPLLDLLRTVNPIHNQFDLWELTTLYQEVTGCCYWHVLPDLSEIYLLPPQLVEPVLNDKRNRIVSYEYRTGRTVINYSPESIIRFFYPNPAEPFLGSLSPLEAVYSSVDLDTTFIEYRRSVWKNSAMPSAIISPEEVIGEDERERLERQWEFKFGAGGNGKVMIAESPLAVNLLESNLADVARLAEASATVTDVANAFGVPLSFLTKETNLANLQSADHQHIAKCIRPRIRRRDEKLTERLLPMFGIEGELKTEVLSPHEIEQKQKLETIDLQNTVRTINEIRIERGLAPVPWGNEPFNIWTLDEDEQSHGRPSGSNNDRSAGLLLGGATQRKRARRHYQNGDNVGSRG